MEAVEYRKAGPEVVVAGGFGHRFDWILNIEANPFAAVTIGFEHFVAQHRFLGEEEAAEVIKNYERRNRLIAPIVRAGFSWILGWTYHGGDDDRRRFVRQIPLIAFRPEG